MTNSNASPSSSPAATKQEPHPASAYAIVHRHDGKRCSSCNSSLGDTSYYRCETKDWICQICISQLVSQIRFWEKIDPPHFLASYYPTPVIFKELLFRNIAVLFQACKFASRKRFVEISRETSAEAAFNKARSLNKEVRSDWSTIKVKVMTLCQYLKFSQNTQLGHWLVATSGVRLIECSDDFWGEGSQGKGQNQLGRVLQRVRALIREEAPLPRELIDIQFP
ncbi:hypothetical protein OC842_004282 [Tilletia horrida]|uniref:NADAR domain-containing protein n=1 Tax=Tilletia horrida TaxID=155126 RepID=A0AAN6GCD7_9BASI|nr:hypothetical protein OC842_004282 [Tilletia horrida]